MVELSEIPGKFAEKYGIKAPEYPPLSPQAAAEAEIDQKYISYLESHALLEAYGAAEAMRVMLEENADFFAGKNPTLELGLANKKNHTGSTLTLRWGGRDIAQGVRVSHGIRVEAAHDRMRISTLVPGVHPSHDHMRELLRLPQPDRHNAMQQQFPLERFAPIVEFDPEEKIATGELDTPTFASWLKSAAEFAKAPSFDYTPSHGTSDQNITAKRITYERDGETGKYLLSFEN